MVTPFLRWAGGKRWLINEVNELINGHNFRNYYEPFLGSASIFLNINTAFDKVFLNDINEDLIETYQEVKNNVNEVIRFLKQFPNNEKFYYDIRKKTFKNKSKRAAQFIYLNHTSYNGIYRVNSNGEYNVPYGHKKKYDIDEKSLIQCSQKLQNANLASGDFSQFINSINEGDLIFLDPPYTVSHNNNGFIEYNKKLFSLDDQYRLSELIDLIKKKKAFYILTNAAHEKIEEIFNKGDYQYTLTRSSTIGGKNAQRGPIEEFLFTNIKRRTQNDNKA